MANLLPLIANIVPVELIHDVGRVYTSPFHSVKNILIRIADIVRQEEGLSPCLSVGCAQSWHCGSSVDQSWDRASRAMGLEAFVSSGGAACNRSHHRRSFTPRHTQQPG